MPKRGSLYYWYLKPWTEKINSALALQTITLNAAIQYTTFSRDLSEIFGVDPHFDWAEDLRSDNIPLTQKEIELLQKLLSSECAREVLGDERALRCINYLATNQM